MDIVVLDSWLRDFLETKATPQEIGRCLSLCGPSVERIKKQGNDWLYEIEVTSNRVDSASIIGIAREAAAILPRFGFKAKFKPLTLKKIPQPETNFKLRIRNNPRLCLRIMGIILDQVKVKPSPALIQKRIRASGQRPLFNLVDITNYVMLEVGHPCHVFDYDKISTHHFLIRPAKKGERIVSLEGKTYQLPGGDTVIDDGTGKIIDLPGIIGTKNSVVSPKTKRIIFFLETNDPVQMRKTSMNLGIRTMAANFNEKGVDPELAGKALIRGVNLYQDLAQARIASQIFDLYPHPYQPKQVGVSLDLVNRKLGCRLTLKESGWILKSLQFKVSFKNKKIITTPPSWRDKDINIPEDLIEEIARIYGYFRLPNLVPVGRAPHRRQTKQLRTEQQIKIALKFLGFTEAYNYSLVSQELLLKTGVDPRSCLKLKNPTNENLTFLRLSLLPSLLQAAFLNQNRFPDLKIFEMANVYRPQPGKLPQETMRVAGLVFSQNFYQVKRTIEIILKELGIKDYSFKPVVPEETCLVWDQNRCANLILGKKSIGQLGFLSERVRKEFEIKKKAVAFELEIFPLAHASSWTKSFQPIPIYPPIVEDLTFAVPSKTPIGNLIQLIKDISSIIKSVQLINSFKNSFSFRIVYQSHKKTLTAKEVSRIRNEVIRKVQEKFKARLKGNYHPEREKASAKKLRRRQRSRKGTGGR
ncbi:MAG: phenylalanine--tRNA ligase subunit beta [Candidatus Pacebacteria bacterium]|nr:phenylalanine--tRNA ligase subunit beta [Candidatus Paceibacterota bacterium]